MYSIRKILSILTMISFSFCLLGCGAEFFRKKEPKMYSFPEVEARWIRLGQPIEFETEQWYPQDSIDIFLDKEVYLIGNYNGIEVFAEQADVRPYNRIYTKFGVFAKKEK